MVITPNYSRTKPSRNYGRRRSSKRNSLFYWRRAVAENVKDLAAVEEYEAKTPPQKSTSTWENQIIAHGEEELPPTDSGSKNKTEAHVTKSSNKKPELDTTGIANRVDKWSPWDAMMDEEPPLDAMLDCWSPCDDGIVEGDLGYQTSHLPKQIVEACIECYLYGPSSMNRLPVFTEYCPDC